MTYPGLLLSLIFLPANTNAFESLSDSIEESPVAVGRFYTHPKHLFPSFVNLNFPQKTYQNIVIMQRESLQKDLKFYKPSTILFMNVYLSTKLPFATCCTTWWQQAFVFPNRLR